MTGPEERYWATRSPLVGTHASGALAAMANRHAGQLPEALLVVLPLPSFARYRVLLLATEVSALASKISE